ncbi:hypothetical protein GCM10010468_44450 [Actinocorallia longicatena]|uniref:DUF4352 domain-containing protein n=1 Tax=Actinocorallia longicatena TaxID=111803 RepID=A0ABP6QFC3_9ACTN
MIVGACAALAVAGCSDAGERGTVPEGDGGGKAEQGATGPVGTVQVADPAKAIATAKISAGGGDADVALISLSARGKLADLTLTLTPRTIRPGLVRNSTFWYFGSRDPSAWLLDPVNLKRYNVVKDSGGGTLQTGTVDLAVDRPVTLNYTFAAPPEEVKTIDVQFGDLSPFRNVPISR